MTGYVVDRGPLTRNTTTAIGWLNITWPEGVYEPYNATVAGTHKFDFNITFHNLTSTSGDILECEIQVSNDTTSYIMEVNKTLSVVSNSDENLNYNLSFSDPVNKTMPWYVHNCSLYSSGGGLIYTNSSNYTSPLGKNGKPLRKPVAATIMSYSPTVPSLKCTLLPAKRSISGRGLMRPCRR